MEDAIMPTAWKTLDEARAAGARYRIMAHNPRKSMCWYSEIYGNLPSWFADVKMARMYLWHLIDQEMQHEPNPNRRTVYWLVLVDWQHLKPTPLEYFYARSAN